MGAEPVLIASVVATMGGLAAQVIARLRFICKPDATGNCVCLSGCTDAKLEHDEHQLDIQEYEIGGRKIVIITNRE